VTGRPCPCGAELSHPDEIKGGICYPCTAKAKKACGKCPTCVRMFGGAVVRMVPKFCCWCGRLMTSARLNVTADSGDICSPCVCLSGDENRQPDGSYKHYCSQTGLRLPNFR
jgi:hypothetical protein